MGQFKFTVPDHARFDARAMETVFLVGFDQVSWPCSVARDGEVLTIERNSSDSGRLMLALRFPEFGELVSGTATLPERDEPYDLPLELARGTLNRLNNQLFLWNEGGLALAEDFTESCAVLSDRMAELVFCESSSERLERSIELLDDIVKVSFELAKMFADFVINLRMQQEGAVKSAIGFILAGTQDSTIINLPEWINCICLPMNDVRLNYETREFDWANVTDTKNQYEGKTRLLAYGPMLDFGRKQLPEWLNSKETFDLQRQTAANFARGYARNLAKKNQLAFVAAGINGISQRSRSYPQQVQLTVDMLEAIENVRTDINTLVSFDQPWGERLAWSVGGSHPMHIADTLLRHGLHISSFGLEVNLDYWPHGTLPRDPLHWVDLVDFWSQFGLPLFIILSAPLSAPMSVPRRQAVKRKGLRDGMSQRQLYNYLEAVIRVLLAKPIVNGIIWRQWRDEANLRFPDSGLVCENGDEKSIQALLAQVGKLVHGKLGLLLASFAAIAGTIG